MPVPLDDLHVPAADWGRGRPLYDARDDELIAAGVPDRVQAYLLANLRPRPLDPAADLETLAPLWEALTPGEQASARRRIHRTRRARRAMRGQNCLTLFLAGLLGAGRRSCIWRRFARRGVRWAGGNGCTGRPFGCTPR